MTNVTMLVHNRPALTKQSLDSLDDTNDCTFTLYGDAPDEETAEIARKRRPPFRDEYRFFMDNVSVGTGNARNRVIRFSEAAFGRGDYLYLSDSDIFAYPNWLPTLIDCYEAAWNSGCRVLGGVGHPYHQLGETLGICSFNVRYAIKEVMAQPLQSMIMRWSVWDQYGPFDETAPGKVCQGEDTYFAHRITAAGYKLGVVDPPLLVNTGITNSFGERIPGWELVKAQCPEGVICE